MIVYVSSRVVPVIVVVYVKLKIVYVKLKTSIGKLWLCTLSSSGILWLCT